MCCVHTVPVPQIALFLLIDSADLCFFSVSVQNFYSLEVAVY